jgi:hypothetical protein
MIKARFTHFKKIFKLSYNHRMDTFILVFIFLISIVALMSLGVIFMGKNIKGSCGGLNAISGTDKCSVCNKDIDPNNPLLSKLDCKRNK